MTDTRWMASALVLARRGLGRTWPNPAVGCVIVREDRVLGRGWTAPGGRPHAEAQALAQARDRGADVAGATAYVTLEPCAHHGRTPPCAEALVKAGLSRVVCPLEDPDPRVGGRGFDTLRRAGVQVDVGLMADEARALNAGFLGRIERGRPHLTLKLASTLDGRIAMPSGESRWITGPGARRIVHLMRAETDGIMIGSGTALADDPTLDVREIGLADRSPVRIVVDGGGRLPPQGRLVQSAHSLPVWQMTAPESPKTLADHGVDVVPVARRGAHLDLRAMMVSLGQRGLTRILCEGGGGLAAALLAEGLVDDLVVFHAGRLIGAEGTGSVAALPFTKLALTPHFRLARTETVGGDVMSVWTHAP